jgi:alpha-beta hydrolase superfamily lysophospholipase
MGEFGSGHQPVLILGGFLIAPQAYGPMAECLAELSGQPVRVVPVSRFDWLATLSAWGWLRLLDRVQLLAEQLAANSPSGRITLVGHSSGGVMLRLWLADLPLAGRACGGARLADALITLGSPHTAKRATALRLWVDRAESASPSSHRHWGPRPWLLATTASRHGFHSSCRSRGPWHYRP